jgi:hypothetical protein
LRQKLKTWQSLDIETNLKFSKGDRIIIVSRSYDDLKYRTGNIVVVNVYSTLGKVPEFKSYRVELDLYPSGYQLKQHLIPILFKEEELEFEDKSKERDWKLQQLLK